MKRTPLLAILALALATLAAPAQITQDGTFSWPRGTAAVYNAAASDKLVVVVSGEHNFSGNLTGNCTAVTYNGQAMIKAVHQDPISAASGGHGQTHSSIWYLDNPGNYPGTGSIVVSFTGNNWVATAIGLSGTQPGVGPVVAVSKSSTATPTTTAYSSTIIAALGMGGQGNTASPLPGITATSPSGAATVGTMKIGSDWAGHAVARASVAYPSPQTVTFNTAKTDVTTVAAVFNAANPVVPEGPVPTVVDLIPGQSVRLTWANLLPTSGSDVWVDVWIGDSPATLQKVVSADPAGLNLTTTTFTASARGTYHGRIDSYLNASPTGTPHSGTAFTFQVSDAGLLCETWSGLRPLATVLTLQREGIAARGPDNSVRVAASGLENLAAPVGVRLRGQFTPETSGAHRFHISGSQNTTLWLSSDASGFHKQRVAWQLEGTGIRQWDKFATQTSAPVELEAGTAYYIEAQVMNSTGIGHLDLGWTPPGAAAPAPIPATRLTYLAANPADTNANNLPDAWENTTGLAQSGLPGAVTEYGDPDRDGLSNLEEYQINSNPLVAEDLGGVLTRETWTSPGFAGWPVTSMTSNPRFYDLPSEMGPVVAVDDALRGSTHYGTRYRGTLTAPVTGSYQFWITGNDDAELWLADGTITPVGENEARTDRFGKRLLARNGSTSPVVYSDWPARYQYDAVPSQRGGPVHLLAGQRYYIEVLHKQGWGNTDDHISLAWQPPGQPRSLLTGTALAADQPHPADENADFLPDNWQTNKGLVTPAYTAVQRGQFGDPDADGLANLLEYQHGTNPLAADTDGDGLTDKAEIEYYRTDPLVSNTLAPVIAATLDLREYDRVASTGAWTSYGDGSVVAWDCRGSIHYTFALAEPGVHEVKLTGAAVGILRSTEELPLVLGLNGWPPFASGNLVSINGGQGAFKGITPWLAAGTHTLIILHDNYRADRRLRIDDIQITRLGGQDLDETGVADWIEQNATASNSLIRVPSQSRTSPVCVEGKTEVLATAFLTRTGPGGLPEPVALNASINKEFYADVELSETGAVLLQANFLSGLVVPAATAIEWVSTNLFGNFANNTLHIRKGDALRLDAWSGVDPDGLSFTVNLDGVPLADASQNTIHTSGQPLTVRFDTPGSFTLSASHGGQSATVTLRVHEADFGPALSVRAFTSRTWTPPLLDETHVVANDDHLILHQISASPRAFLANLGEAGNWHILARLPEAIDGAPGGIMARGTIHGYRTAYVDETADAELFSIRPDGTRIYRFTLAVKDLPPDVGLLVRTHHVGTVFPDGSRERLFTAADFDANGLVTVYLESAGESLAKVCHRITITYLD